jgi:hypothetical protein
MPMGSGDVKALAQLMNSAQTLRLRQATAAGSAETMT